MAGNRSFTSLNSSFPGGWASVGLFWCCCFFNLKIVIHSCGKNCTKVGKKKKKEHLLLITLVSYLVLQRHPLLTVCCEYCINLKIYGEHKEAYTSPTYTRHTHLYTSIF